MTCRWMWCLTLLSSFAGSASVPFGPLRLVPPAGWTTSWQDDGWHFEATAATGASGVLSGPHDPAGGFETWFAKTVGAAQEDAIDEGEPVGFQTAGGLTARRQTWRYLWSAIFIGGSIDRTDLAVLKDGQAWHLYVATGRQKPEHEAALQAVLAMLDTLRFGPPLERQDGRLDDLTFAMPEGWRRFDRDGRAVLVPEGLQREELAELWLLPSQSVDGSLVDWLTTLADADRGTETDATPVPTTMAESSAVDGPVDLAWQSTTVTGEPRLRYYHAARRGDRAVVYGMTTNGMPLWDRYVKVLGPLQGSLALATAE